MNQLTAQNLGKMMDKYYIFDADQLDSLYLDFLNKVRDEGYDGIVNLVYVKRCLNGVNRPIKVPADFLMFAQKECRTFSFSFKLEHEASHRVILEMVRAIELPKSQIIVFTRDKRLSQIISDVALVRTKLPDRV